MLELFEDFEQVAGSFSPVVLVVPGIITVGLGLVVWLAGLHYRRIIVTLLAGALGALCGFVLIGTGVVAALSCAVISAVIALFFQRLSIALLAALLAIAIGFVVYISFCPGQERAVTNSQRNENQLTIHESLRQASEQINDVVVNIRSLCSGLPVYLWIAGTVGVIAVASLGFTFPNVTSAACCALLGTGLIFLGLILLIIYKGSFPVKAISERGWFFALVFAAMSGFGVVEQWLLCAHVKKRVKRKKHVELDKKLEHD